MNGTNRRLRWLEQRRRSPPRRPLPPLPTLKRQLQDGLAELAAMDMGAEIDADLRRRLFAAGKQLAAERTPGTRATLRDIGDTLDELLLVLGDNDADNWTR